MHDNSLSLSLSHTHTQFDVVEDCGDEFEKRPNRKQKSLGLLCQKFLALYPDYPASSETIGISLDEVATSLGKTMINCLPPFPHLHSLCQLVIGSYTPAIKVITIIELMFASGAWIV